MLVWVIAFQREIVKSEIENVQSWKNPFKKKICSKTVKNDQKNAPTKSSTKTLKEKDDEKSNKNHLPDVNDRHDVYGLQ